MGSEFIGSEQVILALIQQRDTAASEILASLKADIGTVRGEIKKVVSYPCDSHGHPDPESLVFSPACRRVFDAAREFSLRFKEAAVLPEHVLLGLLWEKSCIAAEVLAKLGIGLDDVGRQVAARKGPGGPPPPVAGMPWL